MLGALVAIGFAVRPMVDDAIKEFTLPLRHEDVIRQQARDKNLDPALIAAVIYRESKFRDVTSKAGAKGLMQILPETAHFIARTSGGTEFEQGDLADPQINISYGSWYLRYLLDRYDGNIVAAVAAYNAGHGRVDEWGGKELTVEDIRFPETADYTRDVIDKRGTTRASTGASWGSSAARLTAAAAGHSIVSQRSLIREFEVRRSIIALVATVATFWGGGTAQAVFPGGNGKVVFVKAGLGGQPDIWSVNPDGSGVVNLTRRTATTRLRRPGPRTGHGSRSSRTTGTPQPSGS